MSCTLETKQTANLLTRVLLMNTIHAALHLPRPATSSITSDTKGQLGERLNTVRR